MNPSNATAASNPQIPLVRVPIAELRQDPQNARSHDRRNLDAIKESLSKFGQVLPVVIRGGQIVGGNATTIAADELGWTHLDATPADHLTAEEAVALAIALNRTAELASWDASVLVDALAGLPTLEGTGFTAEELAELEQALGQGGGGQGLTDPDEVPEPPAEPVTRPGDLWLLGDRHRLLCGDASVPEDVDRLTEGQPVDMVLTDPPYAIYGSSSGVSSDVADDKMVRPFFEAMWRTIHAHLKLFGHAYVHSDWRSWASVWEAAKRGRMTAYNMLIWDKGGTGTGSHYVNSHELLAFFAKLPEQQTMKASGPIGHRLVYKPNVLHFGRPSGDDRLVNAAKPVDLLRELIVNSSDRGEVVLDLYAGSGSVLIAAEAEGRAARLLDIEPEQVDIAARRWQEYTGEKPILEATGEPHDFTD